MRVALDVTPMTTGLTGVARYARELHDGLLRNGVDVVPVAFGRGPHQPPPGTRRYGVPLRLVQRSWQLTGRPRVEDLVGSVDISHCVDLLPVPTAGRLVMTAHDVVAVEHPELHAPRQVQQQVRQLSAYARADAVLANSRTTAAALARHGVPPGLITVTSLGVTPPKAVTPAPAGRFVLAVGELTARKNLATLVEGFQRAALPDDVRLLVVGPDGRAGHAVQLPDDPRVVALGHVDDATLSGLYRGALAFCFPSVAEGFGLPVLEALQAGTAVAASDLEVLREVAGEAALFVPPLDVVAWASALQRLVGDEDLRRRLGEQGRRVAEGRTWDLTVTATLAAYETLLA